MALCIRQTRTRTRTLCIQRTLCRHVTIVTYTNGHFCCLTVLTIGTLLVQCWYSLVRLHVFRVMLQETRATLQYYTNTSSHVYTQSPPNTQSRFYSVNVRMEQLCRAGATNLAPRPSQTVKIQKHRSAIDIQDKFTENQKACAVQTVDARVGDAIVYYSVYYCR